MAKVKQIGIRLDAETLEKLTALTQNGKLSQAQVITEAIEVLSSNKPPAKDLLERLDTLAENDTELKKELGQIHDLLYQVLHNQQEKGS
jgi:predicted DNA-binding protein